MAVEFTIQVRFVLKKFTNSSKQYEFLQFFLH